MSKKQLVNGVSIKVENRSGFDKSYFNALTTGIGTLTPLVKQLMLPNSSGSCRIKISAQLAPLATDAFLRTHLKLEAFFVPLRLCYGGFESFFCGREVYDANNNVFVRAKLPRFLVPDYYNFSGQYSDGVTASLESAFGSGSLLDYFGGYWNHGKSFHAQLDKGVNLIDGAEEHFEEPYTVLNIFPWICYALIYDEYYRNKFVERPLFAPPTARSDQDMTLEATKLSAYNLPYVASGDSVFVCGSSASLENSFGTNVGVIKDDLLNGSLVTLRQRNYGDDYFTAAMPSAGGKDVQISVSSNKFTIGALRLGNALAEFEDVNNYASPDYLQTLSARYGARLSAGIAQKPILLGSADFPMYTSGVEQTAGDWSSHERTSNPMQGLAARFGRAHAEGTDFVCKFNVDEPGYFMVLVSLVPEAQYYQGLARDLQIFTSTDSLTDLPCALLESIGNDAIFNNEVNDKNTGVFGYVQRYLWHKLGNLNQCHALFRKDENLGSFVVQRSFDSVNGVNSAFLKVATTDLDNVSAVSGDVSRFGCMIDSKIDLFVSEPLSESAVPALANPAHEHGRSVYVKTGGSKLA